MSSVSPSRTRVTMRSMHMPTDRGHAGASAGGSTGGGPLTVDDGGLESLAAPNNAATTTAESARAARRVERRRRSIQQGMARDSIKPAVRVCKLSRVELDHQWRLCRAERLGDTRRARWPRTLRVPALQIRPRLLRIGLRGTEDSAPTMSRPASDAVAGIAMTAAIVVPYPCHSLANARKRARAPEP